MKKSYFITIIILFLVVILSQITSDLLSITKNDEFILPESDETIRLYDESSFVIRDKLIQKLIYEGNVYAYEVINIICYDCDSDNLSFAIGDYLYNNSELLIDNNLSDTYKVMSIYDLSDSSNILIKLLNMNKLKIEFYISQSDLIEIEIGKEILFLNNNLYYSGDIVLIEPEIINGYVRVEIEIYDLQSNVFSGSQIQVEIVTREKDDVLMVRKDAVYYINGKSYVDVINSTLNNESLIRTRVDIGIESDYHYEVLNGILEGTRVAIFILNNSLNPNVE